MSHSQINLWQMQIVILKLRQKTTVTAADHDQRHWKAAKVNPLFQLQLQLQLHTDQDHNQDHWPRTVLLESSKGQSHLSCCQIANNQYQCCKKAGKVKKNESNIQRTNLSMTETNCNGTGKRYRSIRFYVWFTLCFDFSPMWLFSPNSGADLCNASPRCGICDDPGCEAYSEEHWGSSVNRSLRRHGGRHRVDAGLRDQPPLLLPQQRGAGGGEEPLEQVEDGQDGWEEQHNKSKQSLHQCNLLR